ncbi:MAG: 50S ribosomal protein L25 [Nitrospirae bacterium]|nr:50S ribosomal protein L25 [Nitrospirota bacterium]
MRRVELEADVRREAGKGVARTLRREGRLPAVLYHAGASVLLSLSDKTVEQLFHTGAGEHVLITLKVNDGGKQRSCMAVVRDSQHDPITDRILHLDLFEISLDKPLRVAVPVHVVGDVPAGVKEGGVLHHHLRQVDVECLPLAVPDELQIDASALLINQSLHVRDLAADPAVRILTPADQAVVSVAAPISEAKLEQLLTATAKETKEPELLKKEKKEEEVAAEGAAKPAAAAGKEEKEVKEEKKESKAK